mgnify:CR=1 FL=1
MIGNFVDAAAAAMSHGFSRGLVVVSVDVEDNVGFRQNDAIGGELPVAGIAINIERPGRNLDTEPAIFGIEPALLGGIVGIALPGGGEGLAIG